MRPLLTPMLLILIVGGASRADAESSDAELAAHLLDLAGRHAGLCSLPRAADGKLATALARMPGLLVHALAADARRVDELRRQADEAGQLGGTLYIDQGDAAHDPLADWCADLLAVADADDAALAQLPADAIVRALSPYRGALVVGRAATAGPGLSRERLTAWVEQLGLRDAHVVADGLGLWAVAYAQPLAGGDDWGHWAHGPDLNRVSHDTALKLPLLPQWFAKPYHAEDRFDIDVVAGGRRFHARNTVYGGYAAEQDGRRITAQNAYNGQWLWERILPETFGVVGSLLVATADVLYLKDGNGVLKLDAESGAELGRIAFSEDPALECKWLLLEQGTLIAVLGPVPIPPPGKTLASQVREIQGEAARNRTGFASIQDWLLRYDVGSALAGADAATGAVLWRHPSRRIDPSKTAAMGGRVFAYEDDAQAICLDARTGRQVWSTPAPIPETHGGGIGFDMTFMLTFRPDALVAADVYLINSYSTFQVMGFDSANGTLLYRPSQGRTDRKQDAGSPWGGTTKGLFVYPVAIDGGFAGRGGPMRDPRTLKPMGKPFPTDFAGCGPFTISPNVICGTWTIYYDRLAGHGVTDTTMKSGCMNPSFVADGLTFKFGSPCACAEWSGTIAQRSADGFPLHRAPAPGGRLERAAAAERGAPADGLDWPAYRQGSDRRCASAAAVPDRAAIAWTFTPTSQSRMQPEIFNAPEAVSTPAVCVGERVFFGEGAGVVGCCDRATGALVWSFPTGGRIVSAPTYDRGSIYAASGDGSVYRLDASDGHLVWRFRLAPADRRIMVYGRLMSSWPALTSVLVHDGAAYAAAGLVGLSSGTTLCALDAASGELRWEDADLANAPGSMRNRGFNADGQLAWGHDRLWLHGGDGGVLTIDPATGATTSITQLYEQAPKPPLEGFTCRGQDIGIVDGRLLAIGGIQEFTSYTDMQMRNLARVMRIADGGTLRPTPPLLDDKIPSWDADAALIAGPKGESLDLVAIDALAEPDAKPLLRLRPEHGPFARPSRCRALARNAALVAHVGGSSWALTALARDDGRQLWSVTLPGEPVYHGIAIDRAGDVVVTLLDGRLVCVGAR